eukprot:323627-Pyramimonas_sp.AAC.1
MVLPCRFHGAVKVLPWYQPSNVLSRYRTSRYCPGIATVSPQWYCQGTDLPRYCHCTDPRGIATVPPGYCPDGILPRYRFQGTATVSLRYCRGRATVTSP